MEPFKEDLIHHNSPFPVDIFIRDNLIENISADPHWHECYEILYMLEGTAEQQINNKFFKAQKYDLIILNEGDIHSTYCGQKENTKILVIKFMLEIVGSSYGKIFESKYILSFLNNKSDNIHHFTDMPKNSVKIYNLMMGLYKEFTTKDTEYEMYIKGYIYQLIACLIRDGILKAYNQVAKENEMMKLDILFKYIEEHFKTKINLQKAASMLNLSDSYFSRYFKRITGRTFKEYIDFVKICEVEKLILSTSMNISQAAYEVGFCNVSSFNRVFKRVKGYPPGDIKKSKTAKD
ncbi:MAG TPA: AraC family transcriptional regulator [Ruminiclostridium sp.]